jgi:hypothetical protein
MSLLFYGLFHKSDKSETRFLRPAPTERCHKGWRCLHIWLLRGSNANKQKDQSAEFIIDHPELMSIRCLPEFALKRIKGTNQGIVCSITAAVKYEGRKYHFSAAVPPVVLQAAIAFGIDISYQQAFIVH